MIIPSILAYTHGSVPLPSNDRLFAKANSLTLLARRSLVQSNVRVQLGLLLRNLIRDILTLRLLNLQRQHFRRQLEDLVLDLAVLERSSFGVRGSSIDSRVESVGLGIFGGFTLGLDDVEVGRGDGGEVGGDWEASLGLGEGVPCYTRAEGNRYQLWKLWVSSREAYLIESSL